MNGKSVFICCHPTFQNVTVFFSYSFSTSTSFVLFYFKFTLYKSEILNAKCIVNHVCTKYKVKVLCTLYINIRGVKKKKKKKKKKPPKKTSYNLQVYQIHRFKIEFVYLDLGTSERGVGLSGPNRTSITFDLFCGSGNGFIVSNLIRPTGQIWLRALKGELMSCSNVLFPATNSAPLARCDT